MESLRKFPAAGLRIALVLAIGWHATCITSGQYKAPLVPLKIELPPKVYISTQPNMAKIPNLEKMRTAARPAFYAPVGTRNVALGKHVTASDDIPLFGELDMITDGDKQAQDGSFVELAPFVQYVQIDLEAACEIYAIVVWHWHMQGRVYFDVAVQIADDADFTENVRTLFNNDIDNSAGLGVGKDKHYVETNEGKLIDAKGRRARYVRLYSGGYQEGDTNHYTEIEVWGKPID